MKNYKITVNGNVYDVTVEETTGTAAASAPAAVSAPVKTAAPAAAPKKETAKGPEGSVKVTAPMPGKILGVKVSAGQSVKKGEVLLVLEAMKMENEIVAPSDGTIASVQAAVGDSVEAGATLATLN
ncbi:acetyl-CoA carboxylase biotin carboxyl carrier protein subunit [Lacrimispora amygdalina]|uniref:Acetyl-CoA carboxylase biotin carboxyl carrier protein subunit n=1 Tax=Lacrimispora amygdalina TaxID=253257 RepID=A0A3E2NID0_9FIRM|nr:biotin/lipoyl-containing protein [Clostridium indicum]RFZ80766.1 biotin/lipoyl-binding protein [Clostridium indicum]